MGVGWLPPWVCPQRLAEELLSLLLAWLTIYVPAADPGHSGSCYPNYKKHKENWSIRLLWGHLWLVGLLCQHSPPPPLECREISAWEEPKRGLGHWRGGDWSTRQWGVPSHEASFDVGVKQGNPDASCQRLNSRLGIPGLWFYVDSHVSPPTGKPWN